MSELGSDAWIAAFDQAVAVIDPGAATVRVLHRVDDGPAWLVTVDDGRVRVGRAARPAASTAVADVTFTWERQAAEAVARGQLAPLTAFQDGRLRIGGDLRRLPEVAELFARFPAVPVD